MPCPFRSVQLAFLAARSIATELFRFLYCEFMSPFFHAPPANIKRSYYFLNSAPSGNQSISAFPPGFRMIAGDSNRRNYTVGNDSYEQPDPPKSEWASLGQTSQEDLAQRAIGFNCLDYSKAAEGSLYRHFLPTKDYIDANCPDGIRTELMFPSCWDGVNLDSDDHKSHVAYPDLVITGDCPDTHPVRLPGLFYETIWEMSAFSDRTGILAFSNGDPLGKISPT